MDERAAEQRLRDPVDPRDPEDSGEGKSAVEELIRKAYERLKEGEAASAQGLLKEALAADFEHPEVLYALKCLNWWLEKIKRLDSFSEPYERGEYLLSQWKSYYGFLDRIGDAGLPKELTDSCQYALKRFVYLEALKYFLDLLKDGANQQDPVLLLQIGRCCKGAGNWEDALKYLEQAGSFKREDSGILSELADVNALLGETRAAKVLFREAFFLDPQGIDLPGLESEMIAGLRERVRGLGYSGPELAEWIPVWGCIWGIFSVKRELKPVELGRLKQSILSLENEFRSKSGGQKSDAGQKSGPNPLVKPRLLNRYFWLIDHCEHSRDTSGYKPVGYKPGGFQPGGLMDETLLKIKFIDPGVYEQYRT
ncbi:MAG: hypothetical protein FWC45_03165 [Treponema sp.]|nr:hypothetical protein [Treponema sp.]